MPGKFQKINETDKKTKISNIEEFMFKKISIWVLLLIIVLGLLFTLWFGYLVTNSKTAFKIATGPDIIKRIFFEMKDPGLSLYIKDSPHINKPRFKRIIKNKRKELLLLSRYDGNLKRSVVEIINLNSFSVLHTYKPNIDEINNKTDTDREEFKTLLVDRSPKRYQMTHPLINSNGDLLFQSDSPLVKTDFCSNLLWVNDEDNFHHSNNVDYEGNYWVPSKIFPYSLDKELVGDEIDKYHDDAITKISKDGKILYQKSVTKILIENGYKSLIFGDNFSSDPIHLNDIEPTLNDSKYWEKGDLFLSLKHKSIILHFRPRINQLINIIRGPFFYQHDVDIISDEEISIFNNNYLETQYGERILSNSNSEVVIYNFQKQQFYQKFGESMKNHSVKTQSGGLSEILDDGSMLVDSESSGRILFFDKNGDLEWEFVNKADNDRIYYINWVRVIKNKQLIEDVKQKIQNTRCTN